MPAFMAGMEQQLDEMKAIANQTDAPTFENTIVAMEKSGALLTRVRNVFFNPRRQRRMTRCRTLKPSSRRCWLYIRTTCC